MQDPNSEKLTSHDVDVYVGKHIRLLRQQHNMSQSGLGDLLDCSFQQIQKYERAVNRVSAGKLFRIADYFDVPIGSFFPTNVNDVAAPLSEQRTLLRMFRGATAEERKAMMVLFRRFDGRR